MKSKMIKNADSGSYIAVYQRDGEPPKVDLNFFDGNRNLSELRDLRRLVDDAIRATGILGRHLPSMSWRRSRHSVSEYVQRPVSFVRRHWENSTEDRK